MKIKGGNTIKYLVVGSGGPGFSSPEEATKILEKIIWPSFDVLMKLQAEKRILAGGLLENRSLSGHPFGRVLMMARSSLLESKEMFYPIYYHG